MKLIDDFSIPNLKQEGRIYSYKILMYLLNDMNESFFKIEEYIKNVLDAVEGEKDPRNILVIFQLVRRINETLDPDILYPFTKNFFDILESYYPIEFNPPKNSPDKITSDDLKTKLNEAFASNYNYISYLIELIKGKILLI